MKLVGLTGSIGMGKSTTASMFADAGIPVHDADATVHRLYAGRAVPLVEAKFPGTTRDGKVDRARLAEAVLGNEGRMKQLESIIHPLVREEETMFLDQARKQGTAFVILDIPLLFETGHQQRFDAIIVVTADPEIQRTRVLSRQGMTEEKFRNILGRQIPDAEKRKRADYVIDTSHGLDHARARVDEIIKDLKDHS